MGTQQSLDMKIVDLKPLGWGLPHIMTKVIAKTKVLEMQQVSMKADEVYYRVSPGPIVVHCLAGQIELLCPKRTSLLTTNQLVHLKANEPYAIRAISDATVLKIIVSPSSDTASTAPLRAMAS